MANFDVELNDEVENFTVEFGEVQRITVDDFDKLRNRPSYAGQTMTHETNILEVPTAVSQLTNDADYQTGSEVESAISTAVGDEKDAREQADAGLSEDIGLVDGKVDAEADARERADIALQGAIDDEETARKNADNGLQGQIDAITSSSDVVDIVGTYAELLQYPTAGLGDKDVIKVLQDETHNDAMSYYRWNKSSSTWSYIGSEGPYYTKSETNTLLGDKQDTLTAGSNITISSNNTISATDTTYTAGNGLTLTGTEFSADTTVLQPKLTAGDGINISAQNVISADIDPADFFTASETVDGTGSEMTLNNTIQAKIKSVQMDGDTFQQTYSGKNVFSLFHILSEKIASGSTITMNNGASYTVTESSISTTASGNDCYLLVDGSTTLEASDFNIPVTGGTDYTLSYDCDGYGQYIIRVYSSGGTQLQQLSNDYLGETGHKTATFTTDASASYLRIRLDNESSRHSESVCTISNVQLEKSSSETAYEPFTGGPAPNPDYPQPIQVVTGEQTITVRGENLFDSNETGGRTSNATKTVNGDTVKVEATSGSNAYATILIPNSDALLGKTCTLSFGDVTTNYSSSYSPRVAVHQTKTTAGYYANTTVVGVHNVSTGYNITFTFPDSYTSDNNGFVIVLYTSNAGSSTQPGWYAEFSDIQLEVGEEPTAYQPFATPQSYTVDLGSIELCKIGDYQDYIYESGGDWYVHKDLGMNIADGNTTWAKSAYGTNTYSFNPSPNSVYSASIASKVVVKSDCFTGVSYNDRTIAMDNIVYAAQTNTIVIRNTKFDTVEELTTFCSSNPITFRYLLYTRTDTKITDATLISELNALADALGYKDKTIITVSATGTNLPAILEVSAYRNSLAGVLGVIGRAEAA